MATAGTPSVRLWDDVARAYATGVPQVWLPRQNFIPSEDEDPETSTEPSLGSMPPHIHAKANYADIVPPASHSNPYAEDWEASSSDASATADPVPVMKEAAISWSRTLGRLNQPHITSVCTPPANLQRVSSRRPLHTTIFAELTWVMLWVVFTALAGEYGAFKGGRSICWQSTPPFPSSPWAPCWRG